MIGFTNIFLGRSQGICCTILIFVFMMQRSLGQRPTPCPPETLPELSKSRMCRCLHRPDAKDPKTTVFTPPPPDLYLLDKVDMDPNFGPQLFPENRNKICVYFGYDYTANQNVPATHLTPEFIFQAINEHGWPTGKWQTTLTATCEVPVTVLRRRLNNGTLYTIEECYDEDNVWGYEEGWLTQVGSSDKPNLMHYHNEFTGRAGLTALLEIEVNDVSRRPKQLKLVAEATYVDSNVPNTIRMFRIESTTYDVDYSNIGNSELKLVPAATDSIILNLDYAYQVRAQKLTSLGGDCLEPPPPPPPYPEYDENMCSCFVTARIPRNFSLSSGEVHHNQLDLYSSIPEYETSTNVARRLKNFFNTYGDSYIYYPTAYDNMLVILYTFMPVYKDRDWREREVVIGDFTYDTGLPVGKFLDLYAGQDELDIYIEICDEATASNPNISFWTRPPFPAVGDCFPNTASPECGYFHFHSDYFFVECVEECNEPRYICAVWNYTDILKQPFQFQFISTAVYYENRPPAGQTEIELPPDASGCEPPVPPPGSQPLPKEWNLLETHLFNKAYYKRSDVWLYNPYIPRMLSRLDKSNLQSLTVVDGNYLNQIKNQSDANSPTVETDCVPPTTYFLETKDNNLCLCTFWGDNIETWQTHYGRLTSCKHKPPIAPSGVFTDFFKVGFHPPRQPDNVKIRVFADTVAYPTLLTDFFVLHAIYIQAIDQFGIPVGTFIKGHYVDPNNPGSTGTGCPSDQFPPSTSSVNLRYPIFEVKNCPNPNLSTDKRIKDYVKNRNPAVSANLFLYQNRWKDNYPIVCAQFTFDRQAYPYVTRIQFLAFVRVEDKDGDHAYMVELRSDTLEASDMSAGNPEPWKFGNNEDVDITKRTFPPLNYVYYRTTLKPNPVHWERECLDPVKDPERLFSTCRHYITTPNTKDTQRPDLDGIIDRYNHLCGQWITANQKFGSSHPYTVSLDQKLNSREVFEGRNESIKIKQCFSVKAYKTRRKNALHVQFRVNGSDAFCDNFKIPYLKEASMVALNEYGLPIGRPGSDITYGGSFELYNHFETLVKNKHEHCENDDIKLTLDDLIDNDKMAFHSEKAKCLYNEDVFAYKITPETTFTQDVPNRPPFDNYMASMMIWGNFKKIFNGFCAVWFFPTITVPGINPPKYIQFVMEVQVEHEGVKPSAPDGQGNRIITVRSPKYIFSIPNYANNYYDGSAVNFKMPTGDPDLIRDATDPINLNSNGPNDCHDMELDIEPTNLPSDECVCELRVKPGPATPPPPPGTIPPPPLCLHKYAFYNHIFDSKLYRICLSQENARHNHENFQDGDCRTKLEYPRPPEIFPNEQIILEGVDEPEYNNTLSLEPFDPTDEVYYGCGLIKKCISLFADDKVEKDCINSKSCGMIVAFGKGLGESHHPTDEVTIEIFAVARGWAGVGISPKDERMGEDYVMECTKEGGEVNVYNSWNIKSGQENKLNHTNFRMKGDQGIRDKRKSNIRPVKLVFYEDKLYCKFYVKKKFSKIDPDAGEKHEYNLDNLYHYIMAFSHALTDPYGEDEGNVRIHIFNGGYSEIGKEKVAAGERLSPLPNELRKFRLHALFMIIAWMLFITLSIFVARYFKETLVNTKILKMDFWYFTHIVSGILALICIGIAVLFQLSGAAGWRSNFRSNFHTYSGIVALCFFVSEIIIGCIMKRTLEPKRPLINWVHTVMGHFAYNLTLFNMAFSDRVAFGFLSCNFKTYIFVWMTVYYVLHAFMSYHYCWVDYILGRSLLSRRYGAFNVVTQAPHISTEVSGADKSRFSLRKSRRLADLEAQRQSLAHHEDRTIVEAPGKYVRMSALVMFTVITCVYTFWATRKIVRYPKFCYDFYELKDLEEHGFN